MSGILYLNTQMAMWRAVMKVPAGLVAQKFKKNNNKLSPVIDGTKLDFVPILQIALGGAQPQGAWSPIAHG